MADQDRWNERRYRDQDRDRPSRQRNRAGYGQADFSGGFATPYGGEGDYSRQPEDMRPEHGRHRPEHDDHRFAPFGTSGPVSTAQGGYDDNGDAYYAGDWRGQRPRRERDDSPRYAAGPEPQRPDYRRYGQPHDYNANVPDYDQPRARGGYRGDREDRIEQRGRQIGREARSWWDRTTDKVQSMLGDDDDRSRYGGAYQAAQGEHRGRGPKGYRRSDERIREDVSDRLTDDAYLDASDIEVQVAACEVTLTGTVRQREDKRRAETLAESILGVTHVQNNLRAQEPGQAQQQASAAPPTGFGGAAH